MSYTYQRDALREQWATIQYNEEHYPSGKLPQGRTAIGVAVGGRCQCPEMEGHDGKCLGPFCNCH
jgi:hypothetical protein